MPLPGDITTITVTGDFTDGQGNPQSGTIIFTPSNQITDQTGKVIIGQVGITGTVNPSTGLFSLAGLACTDNATLAPANWWWNVTVGVAGVTQNQFAAYLPSVLGTAVDLSQLSPLVALPTSQTSGPSSAPISFAQQAGSLTVPYVSSVNSQSGNVTVAGSTSAANTWTSVNTFTRSIQVPEGTNAWQGTVLLNGTTAVSVATTAVTANSRIYLTIQVPGGTPGAVYVNSVTAGTGFTVKSTSASDSSTAAWLIINHL